MNNYRLNTLIAKFLEKGLTPVEREELSVLVNTSSDEELDTILGDIFKKYEPGNDITAERSEQMLQFILSSTNGNAYTEMPEKEIRRFLIAPAKWVRYAAAVIAITGSVLAAYLLQKPVTEKTVLQLTNDALPGKSGAILTLADGSTISLDSIANGEVTLQGKTAVLVKDGRLVYKGSDTTTVNAGYNKLHTPAGRTYQLTLADGTKVWLNASSSISYPLVFTGNTREVVVEGETYFEVASKKDQPFHVKLAKPDAAGKQMDVEVLGTHFNINGYDNEPAITTTLLEGKIKLGYNKETVNLSPGQQAKLADKLSVQNGVNLNEVIAWKDGFFQFNNADIQTVMRQLERWYGLEAVYEGKISSDRFGGRISKDANASEVLRVLEQTQVHFRIEGKKLVVMP